MGEAQARRRRRGDGLEIAPPLYRRARAAVAALALLCAALLVPSAPGRPQIPNLFSTPLPAPTPASLFVTAPAALDGVTVLVLADAAGAAGEVPVAVRAADVNAMLQQIVKIETVAGHSHTAYDPRTLQVAIRGTASEPVLQVTDADHSDPVAILTVTSADARYHQLSASALAQQWRDAVESALEHALQIRQPSVQARNALNVLWAALALLVLSALAYLAFVVLTRRIAAALEEVELREQAVTNEQEAAQRTEPEAVEAHRRRLVTLLASALGPRHRLQFLRIARSLVVWGIALAWFFGITWAALLFPETTRFGHNVFAKGFAVIAIVIVAVLVDRLAALLIARVPAIWSLSEQASSEVRARQALRAPTIVQALQGSKTALIAFVAALTVMTQVGIPVYSVVTIGGVTAIAVSLASQNLIRDFVSGFLVLVEDQFVVGDYVTINGASGIVERLTLRMVQIRDSGGSLITISHSAATMVQNHSRNWSRVDYRISVDPAADAFRAIELVRGAIESLAAEPEWHETIELPIDFIGIDSLSRDGIVIRARIRTGPLRQFAVERELNARVTRALVDAKIGFGAPLSTLT